MQNVTNSMYAQIAYMIFAGAGFLLMPNVVLPLFGMQPVDDVWIRALGLLALVLASYYWVMTKNGVLPFYQVSVWGRYAFSAGLVVLALSGLGEKPLILFAALEGGLAVWTQLALRKANQG